MGASCGSDDPGRRPKSEGPGGGAFGDGWQPPTDPVEFADFARELLAEYPGLTVMAIAATPDCVLREVYWGKRKPRGQPTRGPAGELTAQILRARGMTEAQIAAELKS